MAVPNDIDADDVLALFGQISDRAAEVVVATTEWGESGQRPGQYLVDLDVDEVCVRPLLDAGFSVLSEESGLQSPDGTSSSSSASGCVVVDPLDGSTNASLGLPWCATSLCLVVDGEPQVAMVTNLVTGQRWTAIRGSGAAFDGRPVSIGRADGDDAVESVDIADAIVAVSGLPPRHAGWRQFRAMGASALDICSVASGTFDAFVDMSPDAHGVWDYLGGLLVVREAGGVVVDALGRELVVLDHEARRTPVAATSEGLLIELLAHR